MKKYDVFISYSRKDSEIAFKICKILEDAELKVFIDIKDIPPTEFPDVIASAILSSKIFLLLASKNYYEGRYSPDELTFAKTHKSRGSIYCYLIDDADIPNAYDFLTSAINRRSIHTTPVESELVNDIKIMLDNNSGNSGCDYGDKFVDLGLPSGLKWARCNIGANKPEEYGDYFAWGEINAKLAENRNKYYEEKGVTYYEKSGKKYYVRNNNISNGLQNDTSRLPTKEEYEELIKKCSWEWINKNDNVGYKVIGPNGNSVFLPAAGHCPKSSTERLKQYGYYWSSTPNHSINGNSFYFGFYEDSKYVSHIGCSDCLAIRLVKNKKET